MTDPVCGDPPSGGTRGSYARIYDSLGGSDSLYWEMLPVHPGPYPHGMSTPATNKSLAEVLTDLGVPVTAEGMRRAGERLADRDRKRGDRAATLELIRAHAPAA